MTRTERAAYPRAVERDRSESKTGVDKSVRKGGGGAHNWGSLDDERRFEQEGSYDEQQELREEEQDTGEPRAEVGETETTRPRTTSGGLSPQELDNARNLRKNALKSDKVDLSDIARSSQAVASGSEHPVSVTSDAATNSLKDI